MKAIGHSEETDPYVTVNEIKYMRKQITGTRLKHNNKNKIRLTIQMAIMELCYHSKCFHTYKRVNVFDLYPDYFKWYIKTKIFTASLF